MSDIPRSGGKKPTFYLAISVLVGIVLASAMIPLKPMTQQVLIAITFIWIGVTAMVGFGLP